MNRAWIAIALLGLCSSAQAQGDAGACLVVEASGWVYNPYATAWVRALDAEFARADADAARDAADTYLDETPMAQVDLKTVRALVAEVRFATLRLRCVSRARGAQLVMQLAPWATAVERELRAEERRRCAVACEPKRCVCG